MSLFLCLSDISMGRYCQESLAKSGRFGKDTKRGDGYAGDSPIEGGFKPFAHYEEV